MRHPPNRDAIATLRQLGAATIYEAQGAKGALDSGMKPIDPTVRLAGPALTVDCRPADNLMLHYAVQKAKPGDVLVVDAKGFMEAGPWGDVLTIQAQKVGIAGLVIDGCVRDANLNLESIVVQTQESTVTIDGAIQSYLTRPSLQLTLWRAGRVHRSWQFSGGRDVPLGTQ